MGYRIIEYQLSGVQLPLGVAEAEQPRSSRPGFVSVWGREVGGRQSDEERV
jgi:hypothetical protein